MICNIFIIFLLTSFCMVNMASADDIVSQKQRWLSSIILRYEGIKTNIDNQLIQCNRTIHKCRIIIDAAKKAENKKAEQVAEKALRLTEDTKIKYEKKNITVENNISRMRNLMQSLSGSDMEKLHYVIGSYKGDVVYYSANEGREFSLTNNPRRQPQSGDTIITGENDRVEVYI